MSKNNCDRCNADLAREVVARIKRSRLCSKCYSAWWDIQLEILEEAWEKFMRKPIGDG